MTCEHGNHPDECGLCNKKPNIVDPEATCTCVTSAAHVVARSANCPLHSKPTATEPHSYIPSSPMGGDCAVCGFNRYARRHNPAVEPEQPTNLDTSARGLVKHLTGFDDETIDRIGGLGDTTTNRVRDAELHHRVYQKGRADERARIERIIEAERRYFEPGEYEGRDVLDLLDSLLTAIRQEGDDAA